MTRTKDEAKITAISEAVFELTATQGLAALSMSKVAKLAGISSATIYIYYADKKDMLSRIYENVKTKMDAGLSEKIVQQTTLDDKIRTASQHFVKVFSEHPREARYMNAVLLSPELVDEACLNLAAQTATPLLQLFSEIQQDDSYIKASSLVYTNFFRVPFLLLEAGASRSDIAQATELMIQTFHV
ncbi:MAG: TetR/AcrR family transcriptional regulator [Streptococcaceae bacterium]|jgi:AcrR family transcriptional regulator|nr:TetR/AcrR family transcriptional regulator [Streptococcaceae bacterium]